MTCFAEPFFINSVDQGKKDLTINIRAMEYKANTMEDQMNAPDSFKNPDGHKAEETNYPKILSPSKPAHDRGKYLKTITNVNVLN